ncbi:uncharacterized protein F4822DRAFT_285658 [Hypoxylon trugodes]|uniref:uncharacterized protein n=1 Tax=Hypoxylon trugodes TaxID=326681 RepID=UPI00219E14F2|nr:uncharacterized protein F4822DRAFT_285658 [Hypoxylon trugodes]KAI1387536.1 hypothetical protein F4822DRAFT_285658 [Hypoxylon trugodes]
MAAEKSGTKYSEPEYAKAQDRAKVPYYHVNIEHRLVPETQELLEKYSHIPREQQSEHVHIIRDRAWDIRAYPCIGLGSWLTPQLCRLPVYSQILKRVKEDGALLADMGTFFGHDLRRLVYDGAPSDNLYGVDIVNHFDVGYDLFRDRDTFKGHFIEADFLSTTSPELNALKGKVDIIVISQVLHQWLYEDQVKAATVLSSFTKPGSWIVGNQIGNPVAQDVSLKQMATSVFRQNPESFAKTFEEVGAATGTKWETQAWLRTFEEMGWDAKDGAWMEPDVRIIEFVAKRIS